ncbi:MAG TPA: hypothetical protein VHC95_01000 [Opitutales bacterium]|nr:hypothetical protein [Opitutales bacterium]
MSVRFAVPMACLALLAIGYLSTPAYAGAAADPVPSLSIEVKKADPKAIEAMNPNVKPEPPSTNSKNQDTRYLVIVHNQSKFAAKGVVVEFHFYNRTTVTTKGKAESTLDDITTTTEPGDIEAGKALQLMSGNVHTEDTQGQGGKAGANNFRVTSLLGWHVEVRLNDKVIAHKDSVPNLADMVKAYSK